MHHFTNWKVVQGWPPHHNSSHHVHAEMVRKDSTQSKHEALATKYGVYYSCLLQLEYFDVVRFTVIDLVHNLFLGTVKHVFKLWVKNNVLTKKDIKALEKHIHLLDVETEVGRLPHRIASNYGGYTAPQWKNWTLIYFIFCLKDLLPESHLRCWQTFVLACQYLCMPILSKHRTKSHVSVFLKHGGNMQFHVSVIFTSCRNVKTQVLRDSVTFPERKLPSHISALFKLADFRYCAFPLCFCKWIYSCLLHLPKHKPRWFLEQQ